MVFVGQHHAFGAARRTSGIKDARNVLGFAFVLSDWRMIFDKLVVLRVAPVENEEIGTVLMGDERVPLPRYSVLPPIESFEGDVEGVPLYAGQSVDHIHGILSADVIMTQLIDELRQHT